MNAEVSAVFVWRNEYDCSCHVRLRNHVLSGHFDVGKAIDRLLTKRGLEGRLQAYGFRQLLPQLRGERRGQRRLRLAKSA